MFSIGTSKSYSIARGFGSKQGLQVYLVLTLSCLANAQQIYWSEPSNGRIFRVDSNGDNIDLVFRRSVGYPRDVIFDHASKRLYWTDQADGRIQSSLADGSLIEDLFVDPTLIPFSLALDQLEQRLYWTAWIGETSDGVIMRARSDGTDVEIVINGIQYVSGICIDEVNKKLIWSEPYPGGIFRANLDGSSREELLVGQQATNGPGAIAFSASDEKLYWTDDRFIWRANLDGTDLEFVLEDIWSYPTDVTINQDESKIYWTSSDGSPSIRRASLNGSNIEVVIPQVGALGIALGSDSGEFFWTTGGRIVATDTDGSTMFDLVRSDSPRGLGLDLAGGALYWTDAEIPRVRRFDLQTGNVSDIFPQLLGEPNGLSVSSGLGVMCWTERHYGDDAYSINCSDLGGQNFRVVASVSMDINGWPVALTIDGRTRKVYWTETYPGRILSAGLDEFGFVAVVDTGERPHGLALDSSHGRLFWTELFSSDIHQADLDGTVLNPIHVPWLDHAGALAVDPAKESIYWLQHFCNLTGPCIRSARYDGSETQVVTVLDQSLPDGTVVLDFCGQGRRVQLSDLGSFEKCMTAWGVVTENCPCSDLTGDAQTDLLDFSAFQLAYQGG